MPVTCCKIASATPISSGLRNFAESNSPQVPFSSASAALMRGAHHVLSLLTPYLAADQREHLRMITGRYGGA